MEASQVSKLRKRRKTLTTIPISFFSLPLTSTVLSITRFINWSNPRSVPTIILLALSLTAIRNRLKTFPIYISYVNPQNIMMGNNEAFECLLSAKEDTKELIPFLIWMVIKEGASHNKIVCHQSCRQAHMLNFVKDSNRTQMYTETGKKMLTSKDKHMTIYYMLK